ncbi:MAG TPA: TetR/AcrR family transcriptional regulator [Candidatus Saccharimonadales bacterium]|nr:TetR/AcrR family transcriptional regulator [Candidatus Saccharimonadales bacterium]
MPIQNKRQLQYSAARQMFLRAGLEVFVHKGYAGTKIRDITEAAKVSPGLLFHYFASKEAILEELVGAIGQELDAIAALLQSNNTPQEIFTTISTNVLESFSDTHSKYMFLLANQILTMDTLPSVAKMISEHSKSVELSVPVIAAGQQIGVFRSGDPLSLSVVFWGALQGIAEMLIWKPDAAIPPAATVMGILATDARLSNTLPRS